MASAYPDPATYDTLPKLLLHNATAHGGEIAMRRKDYGIWNAYTWKEYADRVAAIALGLRELGVGKGDVVGIIGDNRPEWVFAELAAHTLRGLSLGIYRDALDSEVAYLVNYAQARVVFAEDEEQVDKFLELGDQIPSVERIVYTDPRGMRKYDDPRLMPLTDLMAAGERVAADRPGLFAELVQATRGEDTAILCTTSGTTANPKLAELSGRAFTAHVHSYLAVDPKDSSDEYVAILPMPWIMEQFYTFGKSLVSRMKVNFPEEPETAMHDLREIGPTFVLLPPRSWEAIAADVRSRIMDASPLKRWLFESGMSQAIAAVEKGHASGFARSLVLRALKDRLGFSRIRSAATGGAALGPDTFKFFLAMGIPLRNLYGQTETLGAYTLQRPGTLDFDSVGPPFAGVEVRIDNPDANGVGEIVARHPNMFSGYYRSPEATAADLKDGWMHSGDAGYFDKHGNLVVIDRVKDIATTSTGARFSPQFIENKLKFSPYVAEAVILGHGRPYLAAIICIRFSILSKWAEKNRIAFTTYSDLASRPEVYDVLQAEVEKVNATLPEAQRVRKFLLLYKELDADDGELTRTRKVRRGVIGEKYGDIIEAIYSERGHVDVDTTIKFQDGTTQRIRTRLRVIDLAAEAPPPRAAAAE